MQTPTGRHVLIWQADESNFDIPFNVTEPHGHELHLVKNTYGTIASQMNSTVLEAKVNISSKDDKRGVHYVFVPEGSPAAVDIWKARPLNYSVAASLASGTDNGDYVTWSQVERITYELQDLADVVPTHWQYNSWQTHWLMSDQEDVLLETPVLSETGQLEVSAGLQRFFLQSRDSGSSNLTDGREGVLSKPWFFGAYSAELDPEYPSNTDDFQGYEGLGLDSYGVSRGAASGYYDSHGAYWWQHDYFVHSGAIDDAATRESGRWLQNAWYTAANGGFDGRWVPLFDDRPGYEPVMPLSLTLDHQPYKLNCTDYRLVTATATGGTPPFTFVWSNGAPTTTSSSISQAQVLINTTVTVTVRDAAGATRSASRYIDADCEGSTDIR